MSTLAVMKARIEDEIARSDLTDQIENAINTAIDSYKYRRFDFNSSSFVDAPASSTETGNAWMVEAEDLIRARAKYELYTNVIRGDAGPAMAAVLAEAIKEALARLRLSVQHLTEGTTTAGTLGRMKARIANEIDRADMTQQIANAISAAITAYKYQSFSFNSTFVDEPATDNETGNVWMVEAESLIRHRAKAELYESSLPIMDSQVAGQNLSMAERNLVELKTSRVHQTTTTAGTLGRMKQRIANEIDRSDLDTQIARAITDSIESFQHKKFSFNNSRFTFSTVDGQEFYTSSDAANLAPDVLQKIEYVMLYIGDTPRRLVPMSPDRIESASANGIMEGDPYGYCWYAEQLRLYPVPNATRTVRIAAKIRPAAPASDAEADNAWMVEAERLVRTRAKFELYTNVIGDRAKAAEMLPLVRDAFDQLREKDTDINMDGPYGVVEPMRF